MKRAATAEAYIEAHPRWEKGLKKLVSLLRGSGLEETIKWGAPHYSLNGRNVVGIAAFNNHFALWFHQGVFLKDPENILHNAQEGKTKGLRQVRYAHEDEIDEDLLRVYIAEAIENEKSGKSIKTAQPGKYDMPPQLLKALSRNKEAKKAFNALTPGRQKEYAEYISSAKRDSTKESRLIKILPMIIHGLGLNDKYRE